ncbi:phoH-like family protein, partial [Chlamydia psittaci 06-1683]
RKASSLDAAHLR